MEGLLQIDYRSIFVPSLHLAEVVLRGTLVYLFLFIILRVLRREAGAISIADLLVVVLIADAAQNAMASEYKSITEGAVLVGTIASWDYFLDWMGYRFPWFHRLLTPAPLPLIKDGRIMKKTPAPRTDHRRRTVGQLRASKILPK
jgi:uncharacterized membrane protein YcaP (DUF421 family)